MILELYKRQDNTYISNIDFDLIFQKYLKPSTRDTGSAKFFDLDLCNECILELSESITSQIKKETKFNDMYKITNGINLSISSYFYSNEKSYYYISDTPIKYILTYIDGCYSSFNIEIKRKLISLNHKLGLFRSIMKLNDESFTDSSFDTIEITAYNSITFNKLSYYNKLKILHQISLLFGNNTSTLNNILDSIISKIKKDVKLITHETMRKVPSGYVLDLFLKKIDKKADSLKIHTSKIDIFKIQSKKLSTILSNDDIERLYDEANVPYKPIQNIFDISSIRNMYRNLFILISNDFYNKNKDIFLASCFNLKIELRIMIFNFFKILDNLPHSVNSAMMTNTDIENKLKIIQDIIGLMIDDIDNVHGQFILWFLKTNLSYIQKFIPETYAKILSEPKLNKYIIKISLK